MKKKKNGNGFSDIVEEIEDEEKKIVETLVKPLIVKFKLRDVLQVIIGASILAIPVGFTEETWHLGDSLPLINISGFLFASLIFIGLFVYYHYHRDHMNGDKAEFIKRVIATYIISFFVVAILLTLIQKAPWNTDLLLAFKRVVLVTFPASMSGTIADVIK